MDLQHIELDPNVQEKHIELDFDRQMNKPDEKHIERLLDAAKAGDLKIVQHLIEVDMVNVNATGFMGWTAALWCARNGHLHVLEYLHSKHANLMIPDCKGDTVVHKAAANNQFGIVHWLKEQGFPVDVENRSGQTPSKVSTLQNNTFM